MRAPALLPALAAPKARKTSALKKTAALPKRKVKIKGTPFFMGGGAADVRRPQAPLKPEKTADMPKKESADFLS